MLCRLYCWTLVLGHLFEVRGPRDQAVRVLSCWESTVFNCREKFIVKEQVLPHCWSVAFLREQKFDERTEDNVLHWFIRETTGILEPFSCLFACASFPFEDCFHIFILQTQTCMKSHRKLNSHINCMLFWKASLLITEVNQTSVYTFSGKLHQPVTTVLYFWGSLPDSWYLRNTEVNLVHSS